MPGSSSRLWTSAACRSLLQNSVKNFRKAVLPVWQPSCPVSTGQNRDVAFSSTPNLASWGYRCRKATETGDPRSWQNICSPSFFTKSNVELYSSSTAPPAWHTIYLTRQFASSVLTARRPLRSSHREEGNSNAFVKYSGFKKGKTGLPAPGKVEKPFRVTRSSVQELKTEDGRRKQRSVSMRADSKKQNMASIGRFLRGNPGRQSPSPTLTKGRRQVRGGLSSIKIRRSHLGKGNPGSVLVRRHSGMNKVISSGRPFRSKLWRGFPSPSRKETAPIRVKFKDRPDNEGLNLTRKRKRIRPSPKDIAYKRALDSEATAGSSQEPSAQEKPSSLGSQFRQIQPSRELLAHIEENFLGRRRLVEWRKGGYDPKQTAPLDDLPDEKRRNPIQETVFKQKPLFIAAAKHVLSLPPPQYPEIAFAGRSNVGKSSLVNALTRRWGVARTSDKPGLTQSINFFKLGSQLCLVDLPGYGFAYAKETVKEEWEELVKEYVQMRSNLKRVCLLVDAKWGLKPRDMELLQLMESAGTLHQIVLTKTDVLPPLDLARRATQILEVMHNHRCLIRPLIMVSSKTGAGLQGFRASLATVATNQSRIIQS